MLLWNKIRNQAFKIQIRRRLTQGACIALFDVMINDLPRHLDKFKNVKTALFVDNTVLWALLPKCQKYQFSQIWNEALTTLSTWCKKNAMTISTQKAFYQIFTVSHKEPTISQQITTKPFLQIHVAKYLGMYLDGKRTWRNHAEKNLKNLRKN
jgi:hypothetical protein